MNIQFQLHAPQIIYLVIVSILLVATFVYHGEKTKIDFPMSFIFHTFFFILLYWGGFFG